MSFLARLKSETTESHVDLEKSLDVLKRVSSEDAYRALLTRFLTLYEPLEDNLAKAADWPALGWDFSDRLKTPWLKEDLLALRVSAVEISAWPRWTGALPLESFGAVVGSLYVIEGSTLGGQILSRQFRATLGITPERGGRFFQAYGEATVPRWRAFGAWAESKASSAAGALEEPAIRGARQTFDAFSQWLS